MFRVMGRSQDTAGKLIAVIFLYDTHAFIEIGCHGPVKGTLCVLIHFEIHVSGLRINCEISCLILLHDGAVCISRQIFIAVPPPHQAIRCTFTQFCSRHIFVEPALHQLGTFLGNPVSILLLIHGPEGITAGKAEKNR